MKTNSSSIGKSRCEGMLRTTEKPHQIRQSRHPHPDTDTGMTTIYLTFSKLNQESNRKRVESLGPTMNESIRYHALPSLVGLRTPRWPSNMACYATKLQRHDCTISFRNPCIKLGRPANHQCGRRYSSWGVYENGRSNRREKDPESS